MDAFEKTTLGLNLPTDPRWIDIAAFSIDEILIDHAWCEQKAASSCISLIIQFPEKEKLVEVLSPIVCEEWSHFRLVLKEMEKRSIKLGYINPDEYVIQLLKHERKGDKRDNQLLEKLLINALIEARSCERFKLLHKHLDDFGLKAFYFELMVSEAGHYRSFIDLAKAYLPEEQVEKRWKEFLIIEAEIVKNIGFRKGRLH